MNVGPRRPDTVLRRSLRRAADLLLPRALLVRRGGGDGRRVALTFDDGPDGLTREYLDVLDGFAARATFFVLGENCERHRGGLAEIERRGHEIASHGFSHRKLPALSVAEITFELDRTRALLPAGANRRLLRPPQGAISPRSLLVCAAAGYTTVLWSLDSDDCRTERPDQVIATACAARPGDIVLLHEGQRWTLDALPEILRRLRETGHELCTVGELLSG